VKALPLPPLSSSPSRGMEEWFLRQSSPPLLVLGIKTLPHRRLINLSLFFSLSSSGVLAFRVRVFFFFFFFFWHEKAFFLSIMGSPFSPHKGGFFRVTSLPPAIFLRNDGRSLLHDASYLRLSSFLLFESPEIRALPDPHSVKLSRLHPPSRQGAFFFRHKSSRLPVPARQHDLNPFL